MKLVHWPWVGSYIWYSEKGTGWGRSQPRTLLTVPNVTTHPSTVRVPITVLLYNGPLLYGFNVPVKGSTFLSVNSPTGQTPQRIVTVDSLKDADLRKDVPLGGLDDK